MNTLFNWEKFQSMYIGYKYVEFLYIQVIMLSVLHIKDPNLQLDSQVLLQFLITNDNKITTLQVRKLSLIKTYWCTNVYLLL